MPRRDAAGEPIRTSKEWETYRQALQLSRPMRLTELHLGGGTPTFLPASELDRLITGILAHVEQTPDAEYSIESDPRVTEKNQLEVLHRLGFRRLSLGVQDFDSRVQLAVNRMQSEEKVCLVTDIPRWFKVVQRLDGDSRNEGY